MKCGLYKVLYRLIPLARWRAFLSSHHLDRCSVCAEEFSFPDALVSSTIGYTADNVELPDHMWQRIQHGITEVQSPAHRPRKWFPVYVSTFASLLVLLLVYLWLVPGQTVTPNQDMLVVENRNIIIHSIKVDNNPAQTVYFQSGQNDRVIVWVTPKETL